MTTIPGEQILQFEQLIGQILSDQNSVRAQAEAAFNEAKKSNPDFSVLALMHLLRASQHEQIRALSAVLLRRIVGRDKDSLWSVINANTQAQLKIQLLEALEVEKTSSQIRGKLSDCVSRLANAILGEGGKGDWPELLPFMFKLSKSEFSGHRESALDIFGQLAAEIGESFRPHFALLSTVLQSGLNDQSTKVRLAALGATAVFLQVLKEPPERAQFQQLIPLMLNTVAGALNSGEEEDARTALQMFVDLVEIDPTFLRPHILSIFNAMVTISTAPQLESNTRHLGIEFLITLAEKKPGMTKKLPNFVQTLLPIILNMMLQLDDDENWNTSADEDDIDIADSDIGEESLDRLALSLGGKSVIPLFSGLFVQMLQNKDWKHRHTALMGISILGEGCSKTLTPELNNLVKTIVPFTQDPHPRVRWAACNALGQMSLDFGPEFQSLFHAQVVPALINVMDDKANPRVQSHAAAAVINFCENSDSDVLIQYTDNLIAKLLMLLQQGNKIVQEQVVTAIAAIADGIQSNFTKYYDSVMPYLKNILEHAVGSEYRMLRGKAMECISLIGVAVGKEKFYQDAKQVIDLMLKAQQGQLDNDDPQISFLLQSWARICRCMGQDFVPYLDHVMPHLLKSAKISPNLTITDASEESEYDNDDGWEFIPVGDKRIGINTSALEEKSTACNMIYCFAQELKEGFFPYVDTVAKLLVPLFKFFYHDGVRSAAISTLPHLLTSTILYFSKNQAATGADKMYTSSLWNFALPPLLEAIKEEPDAELIQLGIETYADCLDVIGYSILTGEQMSKTNEVILSVMQEILTRRAKRDAQKKEEDHDDEEDERIEEEEEKDQEIVVQIAELIGRIAKHHKESYLAFFHQQLSQPVFQMMQPTSITSDKHAAIFILDDLVEHIGGPALALFQPVIPTLITYIGDSDPSIRQAAVYGIGECVKAAANPPNTSFIQLLPEIVSRINQIVVLPDSRNEEYINPTENAIAAFGKVCMYQGSSLDLSKLLPLWLSWLPVTHDKVESKVTYNLLCSFVERSNKDILGEQLTNLPRIVSIFAEVLNTELIDEELTSRIVNILRQLALQPDIISKIANSLSQSQRQKVQSYLP